MYCNLQHHMFGDFYPLIEIRVECFHVAGILAARVNGRREPAPSCRYPSLPLISWHLSILIATTSFLPAAYKASYPKTHHTSWSLPSIGMRAHAPVSCT